jgi:hypothetical protein
MERNEEQEVKGFTVSDKRFTTRTKSREEPRSERATPLSSAETGKASSPPPVTFTTFLFSLSSATMMYLGEIPDPVSQQKTKDLTLAKHHIDIIMMLQEKTRGNLTAEEENLLSDLLYNLHIQYVQAVKK